VSRRIGFVSQILDAGVVSIANTLVLPSLSPSGSVELAEYVEMATLRGQSTDATKPHPETEGVNVPHADDVRHPPLQSIA
jgi:hypothetical protein